MRFGFYTPPRFGELRAIASVRVEGKYTTLTLICGHKEVRLTRTFNRSGVKSTRCAQCAVEAPDFQVIQ